MSWGLNGSNGSPRGRKRAIAPKRRGATKAQQEARRKFLAESGVEIRPEDVEAVIHTLRK